VVFTVDDGYFDFTELGAPVFAAFDAPVTVFATTGFLDGTYWHWWDRIEHVIRNTRSAALSVPLNGTVMALQLGSEACRTQVATQIAVECTTLPEWTRTEFITSLAVAADVDIPARPPASYAPMTWEEARRLEKQGVSFGPHTVTHPILPRTTHADAAWQIRESWDVLQQRVAKAVPILAYPNGDHGRRDVELVAHAGLAGAVTTEPAYANSKRFHHADGRFAIPRFPYPDYCPDNVCLTATGFVRVSTAVRRAFAGRAVTA
jgi:peptidoglycan/xylan/chitin deacetylase (PgdA/CDA1 family)